MGWSLEVKRHGAGVETTHDSDMRYQTWLQMNMEFFLHCIAFVLVSV